MWCLGRPRRPRLGQALPFVDALLLLLVWLNKPLADADEAAIHEASLQQVVDGFEQERPALVGQAALPLAVLLAWRQTSESAPSSGTLTTTEMQVQTVRVL